MGKLFTEVIDAGERRAPARPRGYTRVQIIASEFEYGDGYLTITETTQVIKVRVPSVLKSLLSFNNVPLKDGRLIHHITVLDKEVN